MGKLGATDEQNLGSSHKQQDNFALSVLKAKLIKLLQYLSLAERLLW